MNNKGLLEHHEKILLEMGAPDWIANIKCPFCGDILGVKGIRGINLCLNTRNFGDISIEILCEKCSKLDTVYFREKITSIMGFISLLTDKKPQSEPILEENMYKMQYNNTIESMIKETGGEIIKFELNEKGENNGNI